MVDKQSLRESYIFADLSEAQMDKVANLCQSEQYEAGSAMFSEKSPAGKLYVLEKGKVALQMQLPPSRGELSRRVTIDYSRDGDIVGWSAVVECHPYTLTAVCLEPTRAVAIDGAALRRLLSEDHDMGYHMFNRLIRVVASRLDETRQLLATERMAVPYV